MAGGLSLILAHPDDESFMAAGAARLAADRTLPVSLVCATRGELGALGDPPLATRDELPALRERELRDACAILGVGRLELLDYRDRALADAPADAMRAALVRAIRHDRPRVVITFDPHGVTGHPDHLAIHRFAMDAVTAAADERWLPECGPPHRVGRVVWPAPVFPWDEWRPAVLARKAGVDFLIDVTQARDAKARALRAHRTQRAGVEPRWFAHPESDALLSTE
jgi:N-acetylglucosamine malate deacetylase 2